MGSTATGAAGERGIAGGGSIVHLAEAPTRLPANRDCGARGPAIVSGQDNPPAAATGRHALLAMGFTESQIADGSAARAALGGPFGSPGKRQCRPRRRRQLAEHQPGGQPSNATGQIGERGIGAGTY